MEDKHRSTDLKKLQRGGGWKRSKVVHHFFLYVGKSFCKFSLVPLLLSEYCYTVIVYVCVFFYFHFKLQLLAREWVTKGAVRLLTLLLCFSYAHVHAWNTIFYMYACMCEMRNLYNMYRYMYAYIPLYVRTNPSCLPTFVMLPLRWIDMHLNVYINEYVHTYTYTILRIWDSHVYVSLLKSFLSCSN